MPTLEQLLANIQTPYPDLHRILTNGLSTTAFSTNPSAQLNVVLALTASPSTMTLLNAQAAAGTLTSFGALPADSTAGAEYYGTTIRLPIAKLTNGAGDGYSTITLANILAHEGQHAANSGFMQQTSTAFSNGVSGLAQTGSVQDYTLLLQGRQSAHNYDETSSAIAGWNAGIEALLQQRAASGNNAPLVAADVAGLAYAEFFFQGTSGTATTGLTFGANFKVDLTTENLTATGNNYFFAPNSQVFGGAGYASGYAASDIAVICNATGGQNIRLDFSALQIDAEKVRSTISSSLTGSVNSCRISDIATNQTHDYQKTGDSATLSTSTPITLPNGITGTEIQNYDVNGYLINTTTRDAQGNTLSTTDRQTYDDGSSLETTTLPSGQVTTRAFNTEGTLTTSQTTKVNPSTNQTQQTVLVQVDDDGNTLITTTNANGSGTMQVLDSEGRVIGQASFQRTHNGAGSMDGEAGTVTALVGGKAVTYSAAFDQDFGLVSFDGSGGSGEDESDTSTTLGQVSLLGVKAIGEQAVNYSPVNASMAAADLNLADLWAYGGYSQNLDGTTSSTPTLQASHELQQATATANPNLTGQSQLVAPPVAVAGNPSALAQLNSWANDHADFTQGLNGAMTLLRGLQTNNKISITTGDAGRPHGDWLSERCVLGAANDVAWRVAA